MVQPNGYLKLLAQLGIGGAHPGGLALTKKVLQNLKIGPETRIIDIGCGTGQTAAYLRKTYRCQVTALDLHGLMLKKAKERFKKEKLDIPLIQGNAECLPLESGRFDIVLAESVTIFTATQKSIAEYSRILCPGGTLLDIELAACPSFKQAKDFLDFYQIKKVPTEKEWRKLFLNANFKSVKIIQEGSVSAALQANIQSPDEIPDLNPSPSYQSSHLDLSLRHSLLMDQYSTCLKYCVFQNEKR